MIINEQIEKLVNAFGQTISDLPDHYSQKQWFEAQNAAYNWILPRTSASCIWATNEYICHLVNIIDRMEAALETAMNASPCENCEYWNDHFDDTCPCYVDGKYQGRGFRLAASYLVDTEDY